ncbi:MAG: hypothetical protein IKF91_04050 [Bacilli bacterium]|nr:hypothetical protein [Bacilli bacterium]
MKKVLLIIFTFIFCFNVDAKDKDYISIDSKDGIIIIGDLIQHINLYDDYVDDGASFYDENGNDLSSSIVVNYFNHDRQVSEIDTRFNDNYLVTYRIKYNGKEYKASRIVIISDTEAPVFNEFKTKVITDLEAATYDVSEGVIASDNSSKVKVSCDNSLSVLSGSYSILCKATDKSGNVSTKRRLIKVIKGIIFNYDNKLTINFPKGDNYIYKYSLDGISFTECNSKEVLNVSSGSVIAAVYLYDELITSSTYLID